MSEQGKMKTKLILRAWEVITCKNGHPCYLTTKQVPVNTTMITLDGTIPLNGCVNHVLLDRCLCTQCKGRTFWYELGSMQCWVKEQDGSIRRRNDLNYVEVEQDD
jgi:hypothetical protein